MDVFKLELRESLRVKLNNLKLSMELVPSSCWWSNVRKHLTSTQWNKLKAQVFERASHKCEICGGIGTKHPVECHEVWDYNEETGIQTLQKLLSICPLCHQVKHIGHTLFLGPEAEIRAIERFKTMNNLSREEALELRFYYHKQWQNRSYMDWKFDISHLEEYGLDIGRTKFNEVDRKHFAKEVNFIKSGKKMPKPKAEKKATRPRKLPLDAPLDFEIC